MREHTPNNNEITVTCWNCLNIFHSYPFQEVVKCPKCNKYNWTQNSNYSRNLNNLVNDTTINNSEKIISCPFCFTNNLFHEEADELICYKCAKNIRDGFSNSFQIDSEKNEALNNKKIIGWRIIPSHQTILTPPNPTTTSLDIESNTDYLLKKILKKLKKQKNLSDIYTNQPLKYNLYPSPYVFPYPFPDYLSNQRIRSIDAQIERDKNSNIFNSNIRYVPIKIENSKSNNNGYKITIRKKHKSGKEIAKRTIFEKIFYLK